MKRFLTELEARLAALPARDRAELSGGVLTLVKAVTTSTRTIGSHFKPSKGAALGVLTELFGALSSGDAFLSKLRKLAPTIGPNVAALIQAL